MGNLKYPHLFEPITLGRTTFKNRIFGSPISSRDIDTQNIPTNDLIAYYERKAMGGVASVCAGDCVVDSVHGRYGREHICLDDPRLTHQLTVLANAISRHGAVASVELQHAGLYAHTSHDFGQEIYGPCEGVNDRGTHYLAMTEDVIESVIRAYADAAAFARHCGFGMLTIHGGHGWLFSQFMSSKVNHRTDKWGGSLENRMRFPLAVVEAVRKAVGPAIPIEIRISGSECTEEGYDLDEGIQIAKMLDGKVDLIHVSAGHHNKDEVFCITHPSLFSEDSCNVKFAEAIKKHVKTPVATVGAHCDPELLEEIIASGKADVVEMARALMADPDLPRKARAGHPEEIRPCLRCLACFSGVITNAKCYCAVNPEIGREADCRHADAPVRQKTVLVAGGGIAGMQAAVEAAQAGHKVILCEASDRLGGALKCEEEVPFKKKIKQYIAYQTRQIEKLPVQVRLNTPVTPGLAAEIAPDAIIAALGARAVVPTVLQGMDRDNVFSAEYAYTHTEALGQRVVIMGAGLVGVELGIYLANLGKAVTIIEKMPFINNGGNILHQLALNVEIAKSGLEIVLNVEANTFTGIEVLATTPEGDRAFACDSFVYAIGQAPLKQEALALSDCAPEFYLVGDCSIPKNIMQATSMADAAVKDLGRL